MAGPWPILGHGVSYDQPNMDESDKVLERAKGNDHGPEGRICQLPEAHSQLRVLWPPDSRGPGQGANGLLGGPAGHSVGGVYRTAEIRLQESLGVQVMHTIFNDVIEVVRANQDSVTDLDSYAKVLGNTLVTLSGDTREGRQVSGEDSWLSGEQGAAGAFSSSAGRRVLTARLRSGLPKIGGGWVAIVSRTN